MGRMFIIKQWKKKIPKEAKSVEIAKEKAKLVKSKICGLL